MFFYTFLNDLYSFLFFNPSYFIHRYFFETNGIEHVSPSFISRTNILYIEEEIITPTLLFKKFIEKGLLNIFSKYKTDLLELYENIFLKLLNIIKTELSSDVIIEINEKLITMNLIQYLDMFLYEYIKQLLINEKIFYRDLDLEALVSVSCYYLT